MKDSALDKIEVKPVIERAVTYLLRGRITEQEYREILQHEFSRAKVILPDPK